MSRIVFKFRIVCDVDECGVSGDLGETRQMLTERGWRHFINTLDSSGPTIFDRCPSCFDNLHGHARAGYKAWRDWPAALREKVTQ